VGKKLLKFDLSQLDDSVAVGFAMLGTPVLSYITRIIGTIAHASPTLRFKELIVANYFGILDNLLRIIFVPLAHQAAVQSLKVLHIALLFFSYSADIWEYGIDRRSHELF
jgi:hypothetical protein